MRRSSTQHESAEATNTTTGEQGELYGKNTDVQQPTYPGPGGNASAPSGARPHSSKLMNKLDPRYDQGILEANQKEREQTQQDEEKMMEVQPGREE